MFVEDHNDDDYDSKDDDYISQIVLTWFVFVDIILHLN